jgi:putative aminopeptidase FrvX
MNQLPLIDTQFLQDFLVGLLKTPSPTGFAYQAIDFVEQALHAFPQLELTQTLKGALLATWHGLRNDSPRALTAHVDTLGAMVKEIKSNGRLKLTKIGGYAWNTVEGEGCTVFASNAEKVRGSLLLTKASSHVYGKDVNELKREDDTMEVRLDARTTNQAETEALGIQVGDFVTFEPRVEITNGFVRSRHLDDKACAACLVAAIKGMSDAGMTPEQTAYFYFSNYEEVGHGASTGIPADAVELLTVDMAAVGEGQTSDEFNVTLCVKDSGGPYHHNFSQKLRQIAKNHDIPYKVDVYPYYHSDGEAYWRAGANIAVALIGPGVDASHNYERTHMDALVATTQWILAYLFT